MNKLLWLPLAATTLAAGSAAAQRPLVPGEITRGSLSNSDLRSERGSHYDEYTFNGRRGETVIVQMESDDFDAYLHLGTARRGSWRELSYDDDGGNGRDARIQLTLPEDGPYVVRASSLNRSTGQYTLTLSGGRVGGNDGDYDPNPVRPRPRPRPGPGSGSGMDGVRPAAGGPVQAGERIEGYLSGSDPRLDGGEPFHLYTYQGRRGELLSLTLVSPAFDAYLVLGTAGGRHGVGTALARDDDGAGGTDSRINFRLTSDGPVVIRVNGYAGGTGAYTLDVISDQYGGSGPVRDDYGSGYDDGRDDAYGFDDRLVGRWGLVPPNVRVDPQSWTSVAANAGFGYLDVMDDGSYTWSRNGRTRRGQLEAYAEGRASGGDAPSFVFTDGRQEYYVTFMRTRRDEYMEVRDAATDQVVAYGYRDPNS